MNHHRSGFCLEQRCDVQIKNVDRVNFRSKIYFFGHFPITSRTSWIADIYSRTNIFIYLCLNWTWNWFFFFWKTFSFLRRRFYILIHSILGRVSFRNSFILNLLFCFTLFPHFLLTWWPSICFRLFMVEIWSELGHI